MPMTHVNLLRYAVVCTVFIFMACGRISEGDLETSRNEGAPNLEGDTLMSQAEQDRRIDYVEFLTTNLSDTRRFYSEVFGWEFTDYGPEYTSFNDGRLRGGFAVASKVAPGGPLIVLYAKNLADVEAGIKNHGGRIVRETFEFPGGRRFHFADPAGNELAVWSER